MTITYEKYLEYLNKDRSSDPVYPFTYAMLKAAEVPGKPGRTDLRKVKAFITLYEIIRAEMPEAVSADIQAETERLWGTLAGWQKKLLASVPKALSRLLLGTIGAQAAKF